MSALRSATFAFAAFVLALGAALGAAAQPAQKDQPGGAMQGIQLNRDQPVKIESDSLEVRDKSQQATFIGKVKLTQGDTILQCARLVIFYEDGSAAPAQKKGQQIAQKGGAQTAQKAGGLGGGGQQIKRAEAKGDVLVTQKDQTAKGDNGVFDVKANTITLTGNVVVTQGTNVLRGDRMVVDLTTSVARVESGQSKTGERQRVEGLFNPSSPQPQAQQPPPPQGQKAPAPPPAAKSTPGAPTRINFTCDQPKKGKELRKRDTRPDCDRYAKLGKRIRPG
jgi:lipopolysaccharide export system protein LptA